ncbi:MAG: hypothetical protein JKY48_04330 [Flavobacteriales bacterium]|nr:hypothetical protein [Flavobacteriales bacterium]
MSVIARKYLARKAKRIKRQVRAANLSAAETALIVYDASDATTEKKARNYARFLKEEGIKADSIAFYKLKGKEDKRPEDELNYLYFDKKSINWMGFPKDTRVLKCIAKKYHLLIDLNFNNNFTLEVISSLSTANFKVGKSGMYQDEVCDLTIATKDNNLDYYLSQVSTYLKMINKK